MNEKEKAKAVSTAEQLVAKHMATLHPEDDIGRHICKRHKSGNSAVRLAGFLTGKGYVASWRYPARELSWMAYLKDAV